jgi:hypothetical protein
MKGNFIWQPVGAATVLLLAHLAVGAQQVRVALPMVTSAQVPLYPPTARIANVEGVVHLKATTDGHHVVSTQVEDGNKLLADFAEENLRTWQFSPHAPVTFTVTYTYRLVTDLEPAQNNPRVILNLPTAVEVDALRWPGTVDMPGEVKRSPATPTTH